MGRRTKAKKPKEAETAAADKPAKLFKDYEKELARLQGELVKLQYLDG